MKKLFATGFILALFISYGYAEMSGMQGNAGQGHEMTGNQKSKIAQGKELYQKYCSACHGENALGEDPEHPMGGKSPAGNILAPALNERGHAWHHSREGLFNDIKKGLGENESAMPAFANVLTDEEIHLIIDYFQSLWPEKLKKGHRMKH